MLLDRLFEVFEKPLKLADFKVCNPHLLGLTMFGASDGKHPTPRSIVTAHYTGWTINGKKFDSSRGGTPAAFRLSDLIEGWIIAMGKFSQPGIPGGSTLIFEIELLGIG